MRKTGEGDRQGSLMGGEAFEGGADRGGGKMGEASEWGWGRRAY